MKFLPVFDFSFQVIFVGGTMRSGTTMLHALLCTSERTHGYIAECRYFTDMLSPLASALGQYDEYSKFYFENRNDVYQYHSMILAKILSDMWAYLEKPEILTLKDPFITPNIPILLRFFPNAKSIISFRDPRACVASQINGAKKENKNISNVLIEEFCNHYNDSYRNIIDNFNNNNNRIILAKYEDIAQGIGMKQIERVGITDVDPEKIWSRSLTDVSQYENSPLYTELYGKKITAKSIEKYKDIISREQEEFIMEACGETYNNMLALYEQS